MQIGGRNSTEGKGNQDLLLELLYVTYFPVGLQVNFIVFVDDSEEMLLNYLKTYREEKLLLLSNTP